MLRVAHPVISPLALTGAVNCRPHRPKATNPRTRAQHATKQTRSPAPQHDWPMAAGVRIPHWLAQARHMLDQDFRERLTTTQIARAVGVHPVYLAQVFR